MAENVLNCIKIHSPNLDLAVDASNSLIVDVLARLVCDVRLSDRINVSRKLFSDDSDDSDVDFFGVPLPVPVLAV